MAFKSFMKKTKKHNNQEYFRTIERKFNQLRGGPLLISPKDWVLMVEWQDLGIPAAVITETLEKGFERASFRGVPKRYINSLSYFKQIVEEHWRSFQKRKIGKLESKSHEPVTHNIRTYLEHLSQALGERSLAFSKETQISQTLKKASQNIASLMERCPGTQEHMESIEETLSSIDDTIGDSLLQCAEKEKIDAAHHDAEAELSAIGHFMKEEHYQDIKRRYVLKKLRKEYGIPRVSLFFQ